MEQNGGAESGQCLADCSGWIVAVELGVEGGGELLEVGAADWLTVRRRER